MKQLLNLIRHRTHQFDALRVLADDSLNHLNERFMSSDESGIKEALEQIFELLDSVQGFENVLKGISSVSLG